MRCLTSQTPLATMPTLRRLAIATELDFGELAAFKKLPEVELTNGNAVHDARVLFKLPKLESVVLSDDAMSAKDKERLQAAHPDAHVY